MNMKIVRTCSTFAAVVVALSSVVACSFEEADDASLENQPESVAAEEPAPPPVETDTTAPASGELVSGGGSDSLFCSICKYKGCKCGDGKCYDCASLTAR